MYTVTRILARASYIATSIGAATLRGIEYASEANGWLAASGWKDCVFICSDKSLLTSRPSSQLLRLRLEVDKGGWVATS